MLVNISDIVVSDRIRKDYGDLGELAENIKANTLLNPPVVMPNGDGTYTLIAGERRLRAMRDILGYKQTEANVVSPQDAEQALRMEISENECRKEFTFTERLIYAEKINAIESAKAQERIRANQFGKDTAVQNSAQPEDHGKTRDKVATSIGVSHDTLKKAQIISDNRDLLDPAEFADWDEGKLSTNKAFQKIKAAKEQAERDRRIAEQEAERAKLDAADAYRDAENLEAENDALKRQLAEKPEPKVIEREVERVVAPPDYEAMKRRVDELEQREKMRSDDNRSLRQQLDESNKELRKAREILGMDKNARDVGRDVRYLISATNSYIRTYGGLTWTVQQLEQVDEISRQELQKAAMNLATFASALVASLEQMK